MSKSGVAENTMPDRKPGYDLKSLSKILSLGVITLRKYIRRGDLKAKKISKAYYVTDSNLMKFLEPEKWFLKSLFRAFFVYHLGNIFFPLLRKN